jgi:hypothetical protein
MLVGTQLKLRGYRAERRFELGTEAVDDGDNRDGDWNRVCLDNEWDPDTEAVKDHWKRVQLNTC